MRQGSFLLKIPVYWRYFRRSKCSGRSYGRPKLSLIFSKYRYLIRNPVRNQETAAKFVATEFSKKTPYFGTCIEYHHQIIHYYIIHYHNIIDYKCKCWGVSPQVGAQYILVFIVRLFIIWRAISILWHTTRIKSLIDKNIILI